jgi:uncharacterized iron-regulated protein
MKHALLALIACLAIPSEARELDAAALESLRGVDIVIAGEIHDNPRHHVVQAEIAGAIQPTAIVFEMLTFRQVSRITPENRTDEASLRVMLEWDNSGWPDFAMYYPIFAAAPEARIYDAAVPRPVAQVAMKQGPFISFGPEAEEYGLAEELPRDEQAAREALQMQAHCDALPEDMLPGMVSVQRLRDATLARAALLALDETGGPVLVITGNGHARKDWGMPFFLAHVRPEVTVVSIGQTEDGAELSGPFDMVLDAPAAERKDPCAAFQ